MFNAIIQTSLKQRLFVLMGALLLMLYGLFTLRQLPVDVFPDLNKPTVTLMTEAEGIAPEEVEQLVTFPLETAMNGLEGVTRLRSVSGVGLSIVYVEFGWGTDIYRNRQQVSERLGAVTNQLPAGVVPQMSPISSIMGEILLVAMTAEAGKATPMEVRDLAEWVVRPRLLGIPGVSQVIPMGGEVRQYRITPDVANMERLNISISQLQTALHGFASNTSGGFLEAQSQEYLIRNIGRTTKLEDMQQLVVAHRDNVPILLQQVAKVEFAAGVKRGEASFMGKPAVILSVQKQPSVDTVKLTREVESALAEINRNLPAGVKADNLLFKQANFIESAISNVEEALRDGAIMVVIVLFLFLLNVRTTLISLTAIPLSLLAAGLVFHAFGLSVNTMTLGGLAIALGELVDDAVVDVENVLRRLRQNALLPQPLPALQVIAAASREVRSGVVYATLIVVLVFVPLFFLAGIEGRLFTPLGIAYIVSILASLGVAVTVTPVLCYYLLGKQTAEEKPDSPLVRLLKRLDTRLLHWSFRHVKLLLSAAVIVVLLAIASIPFFPRAFLPAFNEGTLTVSLLLQPGISLTESNRIGTLAENLLLQVPEVQQVGRRTGRAELDEHAEGVHSSEIDVDLAPSERGRDAVLADIRSRLAVIPAAINIGQPISHRLDHLLSGVRAQIALKVFGDDTDTLRSLATALQTRLAAIPGVVDLQLEKQVRIPQLQVRVDYNKVQQYGVTPASINQALETLANGASVAQVLDNNRRADVVIRLQDADRTAHGLRNLLVETHSGYIPLQQIASIEDSSGPNQIVRENSRRRIVLSANAADGADMAGVVQAIRAELADFPLPEGYFTRLEGQFQAQEEATQLIVMLALVSLTLIFLVLYSRYQSSVLALIIMGNIPLALVGGVVALWLAGQTLSVASLVGFITLAGISTRNGILKISHYIHLVQHEGETFGIPMIVRGSLERLTPVLMTALVAAFALLPLILASGEPGKEILHPVALVIFGGLVSSTLLDTLLTPVLFYRWGEQPLNQLLSQQGANHETV
ncbi:efflux RND transporter permease subunit [Thiothrix subterranea]|uniref:Efflux RND transporter permease subunit n=1 Tax=Thiothrix subterranea TaxID=2735563 RepID=A0AA51R2W3_9GAMM|nr:efflux RND transporter permease subunit [Thiothrix subterranea]MDQ5769367.1 efflux RND transporter permease subunit [Thiothrix subterranea]WML85011.1 efflux RND transporter permease subunit [Thiothrix subterranea]